MLNRKKSAVAIKWKTKDSWNELWEYLKLANQNTLHVSILQFGAFFFYFVSAIFLLIIWNSSTTFFLMHRIYKMACISRIHWMQTNAD